MRRDWESLVALGMGDDCAPRPAYQRMLVDIRDGLRDAVIVYHLDRLHRQPRELEDFVDACDTANLVMSPPCRATSMSATPTARWSPG